MYDTNARAPEFEVNHGALVAAIARFLQPRTYVELGAQTGATFFNVIPYVDIGIAVDIADVDECFARLPSNAKFVKQDSVEFLRSQDDRSLDLVFLDSSHDFESTLAEFDVLQSKVRPNGVVIFHDAYPPNEEFQGANMCGKVFAAIEQIKSKYGHEWEFCTLPAQFGLCIARKNLGKQILYA